MDDAIVNYIKKTYNLMIGERTAEEIKIQIGSAYHEQEEHFEIRGRIWSAAPKLSLVPGNRRSFPSLLQPF